MGVAVGVVLVAREGVVVGVVIAARGGVAVGVALPDREGVVVGVVTPTGFMLNSIRSLLTSFCCWITGS